MCTVQSGLADAWEVCEGFGEYKSNSSPRDFSTENSTENLIDITKLDNLDAR